MNAQPPNETNFSIDELIPIVRQGSVQKFNIETEIEEDGRVIAEVVELPGVLVYGQTEKEAIDKAVALAWRVLADRIEHGEATPKTVTVFRHKLASSSESLTP